MPLISNELEVLLPLNLNEISLPDPALRDLDKDYYDEYVEISEIYDQGMLKFSFLMFLFFIVNVNNLNNIKLADIVYKLFKYNI